jgi:hypothetical protein
MSIAVQVTESCMVTVAVCKQHSLRQKDRSQEVRFSARKGTSELLLPQVWIQAHLSSYANFLSLIIFKDVDNRIKLIKMF